MNFGWPFDRSRIWICEIYWLLDARVWSDSFSEIFIKKRWTNWFSQTEKYWGAHTNNFQYLDIFQETNTWINITRSIKGLDRSLVHQWFDTVFMRLCSFTQNTSKGTHHCKLGRLWTFFKIESIEIHSFELKKWMFLYNIVACDRIANCNSELSR